MQSLPEYADWLADRDLIWPRPPAPKPAKAKPFSAHLPGIRAVTWDIYGTLLQVPDGCLNFNPKPQLRLEVALEKTIAEFNMWNSMTRKPGAPWKYMIGQYRDVLADEELRGGGQVRRGDLPHTSLGRVWKELIERLQQKEYEYDYDQYGSLGEYSEKVAYFFHSALQGTAPYKDALKVLKFVHKLELTQGLIADAQPFTLLQLVRALQEQGRLPNFRKLFPPDRMILSFTAGARKPSASLFEKMAERMRINGLEPSEVLHVSSRLADDILPAKKAGFRTALFAGDAASLDAPRELLAEKENRPDRLITSLRQIARVVGGED